MSARVVLVNLLLISDHASLGLYSILQFYNRRDNTQYNYNTEFLASSYSGMPCSSPYVATIINGLVYILTVIGPETGVFCVAAIQMTIFYWSYISFHPLCLQCHACSEALK